MSKLCGKIPAAAFLLSALMLSAAEKPLPTASELLLERARQGNAQAQLQLGYTYYKLNNHVQAAYWFDAAARQGVPEAAYNLARCCMTGIGVEKDLHRAYRLLKQASQSQLPQAQLLLAELYFSGIDAVVESTPPRPAIAPDEKNGRQLLEKLIKSGNRDAAVTYAGYLIKKHPEKEKQRIIELLKSAAVPGNTAAELMLAGYLLSRTNELRDENLARKLLESAAKDSPLAQAQLAFAVENGFGAPPDPARAYTLYKESLQKTFQPLAAVRLANYYYSGRCGATQDIPQAVKLYEQSAAAGVPEAIYKLGECFRNGVGKEQDLERAFELFFQAAQDDYPPAQYAVGRAFAAGEGTVRDQNAAFYWFNQAAMRGEARALLETGKRYLEGNGTTQDAAKAAALLQQALANGMNEAAPLLKKALAMPENNSPQAPETPDFSLQLHR